MNESSFGWVAATIRAKISAAFAVCVASFAEAASATDLLPSVSGTTRYETSSRQLFSPTPIASDPKWAVTVLAGASAADDNLRVGARQVPTIDKFLDDLAWLIAGLTLGVVVARTVFGPGKITFHRVVGGVLLYLIIGLVFVALNGFVVLLDPNALSNLPSSEENFPTYIYYSFTTLSSTGYGDISPVHPYARGLANIEQILGTLFPATLLARLVTLETENRHF